MKDPAFMAGKSGGPYGAGMADVLGKDGDLMACITGDLKADGQQYDGYRRSMDS